MKMSWKRQLIINVFVEINQNRDDKIVIFLQVKKFKTFHEFSFFKCHPKSNLSVLNEMNVF
jgi:hypothetical protein